MKEWQSGWQSGFIRAWAMVMLLQAGLPFNFALAAAESDYTVKEHADITSGAVTVPEGTWQKVEKLTGGTQTVSSGAVGEIGTLTTGLQTVNGGGIGIIGTLRSGKQTVDGSAQVGLIEVAGQQTIGKAGSATVTKMTGGTQIVKGSLNMGEMAGGVQQLYEEATLQLTKLSGGTQTIMTTDLTGANAIVVDEMTGGKQVVQKGRTATITTLTDGTQEICSGGKGVATEMKAGVQTVLSGGQGQVTTMTGGRQTVASGATGKITTLQGGTQEIAAGGSGEVTLFQSGTVKVAEGGSADIETMTGGSLQVEAGGAGNVKTLLAGEADSLEVSAGKTQTLRGGVASRTKIASGGEQIVASGARAVDTSLSGRQRVETGGLAQGTAIKTGGSQTVYGTADSTVVEAGGSQYVGDGGQSLRVELVNGSQLTVDDGGTAQVKSAAGGEVSLLSTGGAVLVLGTAGTVGSFTLTSLKLTGDTVILGQGSGAAAVCGNTLHMTSLQGSGLFVINTDIAAGTSDRINVTGSADSPANKVRINYDPGLAAGQLPVGSACFASTADGVLGFTAEVSDIGGYSYLPTLASAQAGTATSWYINGVTRVGSSPLAAAVLGQGIYQQAAWRDGDSGSRQRLAELRRGSERGLWLRLGRGEQRTGAGRTAVKGTFSQIELGFDRQLGQGWTAGLAVNAGQGSQGYALGSGESRAVSLQLYGERSWRNSSYLRLNLRAGRMSAENSWLVNGEVRNGNQHRWGQGASVALGRRLQLGHGWAFTPEIGVSWAGLGRAGWQLAEGSRLELKRHGSTLAQAGVAMERSLGRRGSLFLQADYRHDFSGEAEAVITRLESNRLRSRLGDSWLDMALGWQLQRRHWSCHALVGTRIGGEAERPWSWQVGAEWNF